MVTMYSVLRDRYRRRAMLLTLGIFGSSVILCTITFLPSNALNKIGISDLAIQIATGIFSSFVLFIAIAELCLDWKERSRSYGDSAGRLGILKARYQAALRQDSISSELIKDLTEQYSITMDDLPKIPDKEFLSLKAYHLKKVQLSKMIDESVGCPVWILRLRLLIGGLRTKRASDKGEGHV